MAEPKTSKKKVEILHPITHSGKIFGRGLHELDEGLAEVFLKIKDPVSREPIARVPETREIPAGKVEDDEAGKKAK